MASKTRRLESEADASPIKMILRFCAQFANIKKMYEYVRQDTSVYVCVSVKVAAAQRFVCRPRVRRDFFLMQINVYQMARALILKG